MRLREEEISFIFATEDLVPDPAPFDHSRAAAFEERLVGALNSVALCLMTSLGHRVGSLMRWRTCQPRAVKRSRRAPASTSITCTNGWGMVSSGVVDYEPRDGTYALSADAVIAHRTSSDLSPQSRRLTASDPFP